MGLFVIPQLPVNVARPLVGLCNVWLFVAVHRYKHLLCLPEMKKSLFMIHKMAVNVTKTIMGHGQVQELFVAVHGFVFTKEDTYV